MLENLKDLDAQLLLFFNHLNNPLFDFLFYWISDKWIWIPFYIFLAWTIYRQKNLSFLIVILFVAGAITAADQLASGLIKEHVMRLRPCHDPEIMNKVHLVNGYCGGQYGFVSSHAANVFALAALLTELFTKKNKLIKTIWIWAAVVSFSRIYLGAHFPGDVIVGAVLGVIIGVIFGRFCIIANKKFIKSNQIKTNKVKMKKFFIALLFSIIVVNVTAQTSRFQSGLAEQGNSTKLVVGIVVDQMRYDYLFRFWNKYSNDGFKRLVNEGFVFSNANFNYVPTYTAPGHSCIYTGTTPSYNGIISNEWYDRNLKKGIYCVSDSTVDAVGTTSISGKMSPRNLLTTTVTDELRLATNMKSKVIGISLKDRGAILPAGRTANAAYWHDPFSNNWITSTYYMNELPSWASAFNKRKLSDSLLMAPWNTLLPIDQYTESSADNNEYEGLFTGETKPVFPHNLPLLKATESELIRETPFGNTFTKEFAVAAVKGENLGKGTSTDFLAVSFSSTDYVGHMYGTNAIELEDTYLRLDREIASFLKFLDEWTGNNYLLFLTADHGAVNNPGFSKDNKLNGSKFESGALSDSLRKYIEILYGTDTLIMNTSAHNIYLNRNYIESNKLNLQLIQEQCANYVTKLKGVSVAMTATELARGISRTGIYSLIQNGFNVQRSADVMIQLQSGWIDWYSKTGTTHGTSYSYDTHVPVIFFGKRIKAGTSAESVTVCDIAPTIATMLNIEFPSGNSGNPLIPVLK